MKIHVFSHCIWKLLFLSSKFRVQINQFETFFASFGVVPFRFANGINHIRICVFSQDECKGTKQPNFLKISCVLWIQSIVNWEYVWFWEMVNWMKSELPTQFLESWLKPLVAAIPIYNWSNTLPHTFKIYAYNFRNVLRLLLLLSVFYKCRFVVNSMVLYSTQNYFNYGKVFIIDSACFVYTICVLSWFEFFHFGF